MDIRVLKVRIEDRLEHMKSNRALHCSPDKEPTKDDGEKSVHYETENARLRALEALSQEICKAQTALRLLKDGRWRGQCIERDCPNDQVISEARINAVPYSLRCTDCEEQLQHRKAGVQGPEHRRGAARQTNVW